MSETANLVRVMIDRQQLDVADGTSILQAARLNQISIPTFCLAKDLLPTGACRVCLVSVTFPNGSQRIITACDTLVEDGMRIRTDTEDVLNARKYAIDLLYSITPDLPAVQKLAESVGLSKPSFTIKPQQQDCNLCGACVQACEQKRSGVLRYSGIGSERLITTQDGKPAPDCKGCQVCIPYCPTGAVTQSLNLGIGAHLKKKANDKVVWNRIVRFLCLALFVSLILFSILGIRLANLPPALYSLLDPLQGGALLAVRQPQAIHFIPALAVLLLSLVFGRFWCGWICPTGTLLQAFGSKERRLKHQRLRNTKLVLAVFLLILAAFGIFTFLGLVDPIAMLTRFIAAIIRGFQSLENPAGLLWLALPLLAALGLNLIERGFWCRYLCPLGGLIGLCSKAAPFKWRVDLDSCISCGKCAQACPVGAINPERDFESDPAECIQCGECAAVCPKYAIHFSGGALFKSHEFDPGRRELLAVGGLCAAAAAIGPLADAAQFSASSSGTKSALLPPGISGAGGQGYDQFLSRCTRCGHCVAACPQGILNPSGGKADWTAIGTPEVDLRSNYCAPDCTRCAEVCPSGAIPQIADREKQTARIGIASVNQAACIRCGACVNVCPYQAITADLGANLLVDPERCNGCGMCLQVCPARDAGAIEVLPLN